MAWRGNSELFQIILKVVVFLVLNINSYIFPFPQNIEDTGHLLLVLHPNSNLILWDTSNGKQIWKKTYFNESLRSFDMDPFDVCRLAFKTSDCILFVNDFSPTKCPSSSGKFSSKY